MKRHLKDKCKDSPSKKQYFVAETQEPPGSPIFKGENWKPHPASPSSSSNSYIILSSIREHKYHQTMEKEQRIH